MKNAIIIFFVFALVGFGGGYLFSQSGSQEQATAPDNAATEQTQNTADDEKVEVPAPAVSSEGEIFNQKGCLACHSVENLGLQGGATGPDLSQAYVNVEGKHGKPINEFLKEPTSAVMSSVIGGNPLTDDEINKVVEALKIASEK
ncbi:Cytochrome c [Schinkia azotoformans MEV2011]|uniref:Cytochrome c n=1 Tax=Schinkia azotoformans MEV2011 TaxID=1348973 RepID=A0A072NRB8_SCHAZ|nr:c-type cytochrome [Schinkia azotoformans]KEF40016.1 Cytochrome c [Schinkia azotoformans MEV2011]MEC1694712.1 c-type cytochrome [Schinkia azotoformans]MEC1716926.1 c-type cytochrome [Schinkia azotoformans]MEC1726395.1 c-type cytochrome [Schinkia azotoformans]MEC1743208.1 c-type cytochrome [Schinkia azotoformans]